jgi:hypothetical protein
MNKRLGMAVAACALVIGLAAAAVWSTVKVPYEDRNVPQLAASNFDSDVVHTDGIVVVEVVRFSCIDTYYSCWDHAERVNWLSKQFPGKPVRFFRVNFDHYDLDSVLPATLGQRSVRFNLKNSSLPATVILTVKNGTVEAQGYCDGSCDERELKPMINSALVIYSSTP